MSEFFNNASVGAFLGAFFAFSLVIITDRLRLYRKRGILKNVISSNGDIALFKLDSVKRNIEIMKSGEITAAPIMAFPVETISKLQLEVIDLFDANHNQAISALLYWMKAIDEQLNNAGVKAEMIISIERRNPEDQEKQHLYNEYRDILEESEKNLNKLIKLTQHYVSGHPELIIGFRHS